MFHILFFVSALQVFSFADWTEITPKDFPMQPPPKEGSRTDHQDYLQLLDYQQTRTEAQCKQAKSQWIPYFEALFQYSGALTKQEAEKVEPLVREVLHLTEKVTDYYKKEFKRLRPYDRFEDIQPCIKKVAGQTSYPSSHAAIGTAGACVLAEIFPHKKAALYEHGFEIGELRVIAGVHHPSDVEAGRDAGQQVCDHLMKQDDFLKELKKLK